TGWADLHSGSGSGKLRSWTNKMAKLRQIVALRGQKLTTTVTADRWSPVAGRLRFRLVVAEGREPAARARSLRLDAGNLDELCPHCDNPARIYGKLDSPTYPSGPRMTVKLNHTIVHSRDPRAAAEFFSTL